MIAARSIDYTLIDVAGVGAAIADVLLPGDVIALSGGLGAGKTTLARSILHGLGHQGEVPSPSFAIVQPYEDVGLRLPVLHCDLYRIENASQIGELGLDENLACGALLIEWPERLGTMRWPGQVDLTITTLSEDRRRLTAMLPTSWEGRWPFR